ncbi:AMP-binding protein [Flavilitoribacter nigricans]|uniref:Branched-chain amino acid aminotransferase n=1 Tax=Flavilitoribacter nigricans (strain ATCC 23147 / DSM 23189 / NBRC 102662 / NCIMB 1420 / SS-2) TaxID=1122177 RepID=A0A2D0NBL3_FLAN2|nr:AMP-binding protein [Flavilitoribacter nigricans]PHN05901.1 branched-chain amino acid aminotransferase [Flavilitoribacter nigricans DSM 23189 = NBRC 102662]
MEIKHFFEASIEAIRRKEFSALDQLQLDKPAAFNWVEDIFYPLNVRENGDGQALIWTYQDRERIFSFRDMYVLSNQLINFLRKHGCDRGDRIYTVLPLIPENWISFLATIKGGYIIMPTAVNLTRDDMVYRFRSLLPEVMIAQSANAELIDAAEREFGSGIKLKILTEGSREGWHSFEDILSEAETADPAPTRADDPFLYFFTSGTTGLPKIVVHTHFTYPFGHLTTSSWLGCSRGDIHYNISSPGWAKFAWSSFFAPWNTGATIFANQVDSFVAGEQLAAMEKYGVTTFCGSPTVIRMLIQEDLTAYRLKLRSSCAAGEPLNPEVITKWQQGTGVSIRDGYGQTETTALVCNLEGEPIRPGSMGKPTFLYDIGIYDDSGQELPPLEEGVICVKLDEKRHNGVFIEYLEDPERTAKVFRGDLYYTGDKAYRDEDGYFWFVGRNDDVIKASAYRIGPFEVESVLIEHEAVVEAAVVASPHELRGYAVKAFIMLRAGVSPSRELADDIFAFTEQKLAKYKVPRIIEFPDALPKTISGKIRRVELRANEATDRLNKVQKAQEYFHAKY